MSWIEYFLKLAETVSFKSKDPSTKIGAVIAGRNNQVLSIGFNGAPRGVPECHERPRKYFRTEHAERNAVYNSAMHGISLEGSTMYVWGYPPCADCCRAMIQSGIRHVIIMQVKDLAENWKESAEDGRFQLEEAGVSMAVYDSNMNAQYYHTGRNADEA